MTYTRIVLSAAAVVVAFANVLLAQTDMKPPIAKKIPKVLKIHGYEITDNYSWLRDRNDKKSPEVMDYLNAENAYTSSFMDRHKPFVDALYNEMLGRIKQTDDSVPYRMGDHWYLTRTEEGKQYVTYCGARAQRTRKTTKFCSIRTRWPKG